MSPEDEARVREIVNETLDEHGPGGTGHTAYADPIRGGYSGYQGACWDCEWRGATWPDKPHAQKDAREHALSMPVRTLGDEVVKALRDDQRRNGRISL